MSRWVIIISPPLILPGSLRGCLAGRNTTGVLAGPVLTPDPPKRVGGGIPFRKEKDWSATPFSLGWARSAVLSVLLGVFFERQVFRGIFISLRDKLFFGCVVIGIILEELSTCCFCVLGLSCRFSFSSTPKENVSRPFFKKIRQPEEGREVKSTIVLGAGTLQGRVTAFVPLVKSPLDEN